MRIGLVTDTYVPQVNGVSTIVRRIVDLLGDAGHDVAILAPRYPEAGDRPIAHELRAPSVPFPPYPAIRLSLPSFRSAARFFDAFRAELVHVHTEGPLGLVGRPFALRRGLPLVTSFHTDYPRYARHYGAPALAPLVWRWLAWFHGPAALTFTPGDAIRDELQRHGLSAARVWGRGVDPRQFHPARRNAGWLAGGDDTAIVLHVGRLAPEKNLGILIAAWKLARERLGQRATFVVAGEGPLTARRGETGLLIAPHDPHAFAAGIEALVLDPARRFALAGAAREWALERDSAREDAQLMALYADLVRGGGERVTACAA